MTDETPSSIPTITLEAASATSTLPPPTKLTGSRAASASTTLPTPPPGSPVPTYMTEFEIKATYRKFIAAAIKHLTAERADSTEWINLMVDEMDILLVSVNDEPNNLDFHEELAINIATYALAVATSVAMANRRRTSSGAVCVDGVVSVSGAKYRFTTTNRILASGMIVCTTTGPDYRPPLTINEAIANGVLVPITTFPLAPITPVKGTRSFLHNAYWYTILNGTASYDQTRGQVSVPGVDGKLVYYDIPKSLSLRLIAWESRDKTNFFEHLGRKYQILVPTARYSNGFVTNKRGQSELTLSVKSAIKAHLVSEEISTDPIPPGGP